MKESHYEGCKWILRTHKEQHTWSVYTQFLYVNRASWWCKQGFPKSGRKNGKVLASSPYPSSISFSNHFNSTLSTPLLTIRSNLAEKRILDTSNPLPFRPTRYTSNFSNLLFGSTEGNHKQMTVKTLEKRLAKRKPPLLRPFPKYSSVHSIHWQWDKYHPVTPS